MKKYFLIFVILFSALKGFNQSSKIYINSNGQFSNDSKKAFSYVLIQKLEDSAYLVTQFDMNDTIKMKGTYKDESMAIPNGKFFYYDKRHVDERIKNDLHIDTNTYVKSTGFFVNGMKSGVWIEYFRRGIKDCIYTYQTGMVNGLFQSYDHEFNNYVTEQGYYINDKREGEWYTYGYDTIKTPIITTTYKNDKVIKTVQHIYPAKFYESFEDYLTSRLKPNLEDWRDLEFKAEITIDVNGRIKDPKIIKSISPEIDALILTIFPKAPKFTPEIWDRTPVEKKYLLSFSYANFRDGKFVITLNHEIGNGKMLGAMFIPVKI